MRFIAASLFLVSSLAVAHPDGTLGPHQHIEAVVSNPLAVHLRDACVVIAGSLPATDAPWQSNGECTGPSTPYICCAAADTGTCALTSEQEVQCVTWIVKRGVGVVDRQIAEDAANIAFSAALVASEEAGDAAMPDSEIIPTAVCGDGILTPVAGEECDHNDANSDTEPDACRTNCRNASCGDGVIDTGETCDPGSDETCLSDCSGLIP